MMITILLTATMLPISLYLLAKNPFNVANVVNVLSWLFGIFPAIYFASTRIVPSYSWRNMTYVGGPLSNGTTIESGLLLLALLLSFFTLGCLAAALFSRPAREIMLELRVTSRVTTAVLIGLWVISAINLLALSGWSIDRFLLPVGETIDQSGYLQTVFMTVPTVLFAKIYWEKGKVDGWALFWITIALYAAFSRHQRRDLVTIIMFFIAFIPLMQGLAQDQVKQAAANLKKRVIALTAMISALALVPILWYSRVYFTAAAAGEDLDPTRIRGFSELLLGSPATGYPTFLLVERHVTQHGPDPFYTLTYLATIMIPRSLWSGKPTDIDKLLEQQYRLIENPSIFWFGELYFALDTFAIPLAFLLGFGLYTLARSAAASPSLLFRSYAAVMFMHSPTLFKNGVSHFVINSAGMAVFLAIAWYFPGSQTKERLTRALSDQSGSS